MLNFKKLDWDSDFWGRNIYSADVCSLNEVKHIIENIKKHNTIFTCYFFSQTKFADSSIDLHLYDEKVTFKKNLNSAHVLQPSKEIESFEGAPDEEFVKLAQSSGVHSRFKKDGVLAAKFDELYRLWLVNSVNGTIANKVLVNKSNSTIAGFITLKFHPANGQIGIIAVNEKYQGKSIGSKLIREAERLTMENGKDVLKVVTQADNINAMNFYKKNGFTIEHTEFIYHYHNG